MKVVMKNKKIIVYLSGCNLIKIDLKNKEELQKYVNGLLLKIQDKYFLEFYGYYDITLYVDNNYGIIMEIEREELEYLEYFSKGLEFNIRIFNDSFLYEVNDIDFKFDYALYILDKHFYIRLIDDISDVLMGHFSEMVDKVIYGNEKKKILTRAKIVR